MIKATLYFDNARDFVTKATPYFDNVHFAESNIPFSFSDIVVVIVIVTEFSQYGWVWGMDFIIISIFTRQRHAWTIACGMDSLTATLYFDNVQIEFYIPVSWIPTLKMRSYSREATPYFDSARSFSRSKQRCTSTTRIYQIVEQRRTSTTRAILLTEAALYFDNVHFASEIRHEKNMGVR